MPATREAEIGRMGSGSRPACANKIIKTPISVYKPGMVVRTCHPSYLGGQR
jgi:hypothetical protein